jgi:hypothetical protein
MEPLIHHLYDNQLELPLPDQIIFQKPHLEAQLQQPLNIYSVWLSIASPAFQATHLNTNEELDDDVSTKPPESLSDNHDPLH